MWAEVHSRAQVGFQEQSTCTYLVVDLHADDLHGGLEILKYTVPGKLLIHAQQSLGSRLWHICIQCM